MRVHVEDDIYISSDAHGYVLERKRISASGKSKGQEVYQPIGYYPTIQSCIQHGLLKLKIDESTATTLKELLQSVKDIETEIKAKILI